MQKTGFFHDDHGRKLRVTATMNERGISLALEIICSDGNGHFEAIPLHSTSEIFSKIVTKPVGLEALAKVAELCPLHATWGPTKLMTPTLEAAMMQLRRDLDLLQGAFMSDLMVPDETALEQMRRVHHTFGNVLAEATKK